jgi:hypothetical protein
MLKVSAAVIEQFEKQCPGIAARIEGFERAVYPACAHCGSGDTAIVLGGIVGYTMNLAAATTRVKLCPGKAGEIFCNVCGKFSWLVPERKH